MIWKNTTLETAGSVIEVLKGCKTPEEANEFADAYRAQFPQVAEANLRFGIAYFINEPRATELYDWLTIDDSVENQIGLFKASLLID